MLTRMRLSVALLLACMTSSGLQVSAQPKQSYTIDPSKVVHSVDVRIYGQFLEHIFNSVHGGLWGDMVLNGGFVMHPGQATWLLKDDYITQTNGGNRVLTTFGSQDWSDYELTLEAMPEHGREGFVVALRTMGLDKGYMLNVGAFGNSRTVLEKLNGGIIFETKPEGGKKIVDYGKWYKIRARAEGNHIQMWVDDQKVIDVIDDKPNSRPNYMGKVGLGQYDTVVRFRNIKVTSLDGKTLWEGLPQQEDLTVAPPYWTAFGDGGYNTFDKDDSPNGNGSIVMNVTKANGECGLIQQPLNLVKGEIYKGRIWLKSPDLATVIVRIMSDGNNELRKTPIIKPFERVSSEWRPYDFEFLAEASGKSEYLFVEVYGKGTAKVSNLTLFSKSGLDNDGFRPDILNAIKQIKPATIRYPGGCFASGYRWKDAIGPRENRKYYPGVIWDDQDPNQMGTDEFMLLCERVGAEPILAVNKGLGTQDALDWMEYCNGPITSKWGKLRADNGHPKPYNVKYWEIDNEVWGMQPEDYAKVVKEFSEALKANDPKAIIIACGCYAYDTGVGQGDKKDWNKRLLDSAAPYFDYISIHYYNGICVAQDYVQDPRKYEAFMRDNVAALIAKSANPKIKIYCSEWGMMNSEWRSGLYTGGILNAFERQSDIVPMSCPAVWMQRIKGPEGSPRWASAQIMYDHAKFVPAPEYVIEKLWRDNFGPNLVQMDGPAEPLNAVATASANKKTLYFKVVNPSKEAMDIELKLAKGAAKSATMTIVSPGQENARNTIGNPNVVKPEPGKVAANGRTVTCKMPALSAGVVKILLK